MNSAALPFPSLSSTGFRSTRLRLLIYLGVWSIPGLAALSFYYLNQTVTGAPMNWGFALVSTLPNWYIWAALTPVILRVTRSYPLEPDIWKQNVRAVHVPALLASMLIHSMANLLLFRITGMHEFMNWDLYKVHFFSRIHANTFTYVAIISVSQAYNYYHKYIQREKTAYGLQVQLAEANLRALKMQVHPHFLFNTLHSVAALVRKQENRMAVRMLGQLGDFLRLALDNQRLHEIPLSQELDFLKRYLALEQSRFGDRLTVQVDIANDLYDLYIPKFILQPLVENAIHHGIAPSTKTGHIDIKAYSLSGRMCISIKDNGPGLQETDEFHDDGGLRNTQNRLKRLYGSDQKLILQNDDSGGVEVQIIIPMHEQPVFSPNELKS